MITRHKSNPIIKPGDVKLSHETLYPDIVEFKSSDPKVILKDTCAIVYKGREYLSTMSHIRSARSKDGINFKIDAVHEPRKNRSRIMDIIPFCKEVQ